MLSGPPEEANLSDQHRPKRPANRFPIPLTLDDFKQPCSPRACHRTEHCVPERRALCRFTPRKPLFPASASTRFGTPQLIFSVTEPLARNGLSLARNGFRFRGLHSGVNGPGLLLRSLAARLLRPFGFSAPPPESVSPNPRDFLASCPLRVHRSTHQAALPISTPLQEFFAPSGSKRSMGVAAVRFIFRIHPIFARSPPTLLLLVWASDHRPRFAMLSETRSNPRG